MEFDHRSRRSSPRSDAHTADPGADRAPAPGKRTRSEAIAVQHQDAGVPGRAVQRVVSSAPASDAADVHAAAARGTATPASTLPFADRIQRAFGRHDVSGIQAHVGDGADASAREIGARAYATGHHVVLGAGADLHTVAHEAAHVIQQRAGVHLAGGVGQVGDRHEQHADAVADLVVQGKSAEAALDAYAGPAAAAHSDGATTGVQREIKGGDTKTPFGTLGQLLAGLSDIDLVQGKGLDLEIGFAPLDEGTSGLTTVFADDKRIDPHVAISPATAKTTSFKIVLQLNRKQFSGQPSARLGGQLHETIIHEWQLHAREHARNIVRARSGHEPLDRIDHVNLMSPGGTEMDRQIARRILQQKVPELQQQIYNAYMTDVFAHIVHLQHGYLVRNKETGSYPKLDLLFENLGKVLSSLKLFAKAFAELGDKDPLKDAANDLLQLASQYPDDCVAPKEYEGQGASALPIYARTDAWIRRLEALVSAPVAKTELAQLAQEQLRGDTKQALSYLHDVDDVRAVPDAAQLGWTRKDDKEAQKKAVLVPRMRQLESLGVDVTALNAKLDLREDLADDEPHLRKPVAYASASSSKSPSGLGGPSSLSSPSKSPSGLGGPSSLSSPSPQSPSGFGMPSWLGVPSWLGMPSILSSPSSSGSARDLSKLDDGACRKLLEQGQIGIYSKASVIANFAPPIIQRILSGERGPFTAKDGEEVTFLKRLPSGEDFYFDSPRLR